MEETKFSKEEIEEVKRRLLIEKEALRQIEEAEAKKRVEEQNLRFDISRLLEQEGCKLHLLHEKEDFIYGRRRIEYLTPNGELEVAFCYPEELAEAIIENARKKADAFNAFWPRPTPSTPVPAPLEKKMSEPPIQKGPSFLRRVWSSIKDYLMDQR